MPGLAVASVASWLATAGTSSLVLAVLTLILASTLTGIATYTIVPRPSRRVATRIAAAAPAAVAVGVFVATIDSPWSWTIPPVALLIGLPTARSRVPRLLALAVMAIFVIAVWMFGLP